MGEPEETDDAPPLSLARLRAAFATMLGSPSREDEPGDSRSDLAEGVTPEGIVEALLFVGRPGDKPIPVEEIAAAIRGVSPEEVHDFAERLNAVYREEGRACRIETTDAGLRLCLADGLERVADRMRGRVRATRLSPAAVETLAVVAYRQPIASAEIDELRGERSVSALGLLERTGLVRRDTPGEGADAPRFCTTDRFLRLLELADLAQLPRVAELDD